MPRISAKVKAERQAAFDKAEAQAWEAYHQEMAPFEEACERAISLAWATRNQARSEAGRRLAEVINKARDAWRKGA